MLMVMNLITISAAVLAAIIGGLSVIEYNADVSIGATREFG